MDKAKEHLMTEEEEYYEEAVADWLKMVEPELRRLNNFLTLIADFFRSRGTTAEDFLAFIAARREKVRTEDSVRATSIPTGREEHGYEELRGNIDPKERECLGCGKMFLSEGAHNRFCPKCAERRKSR